MQSHLILRPLSFILLAGLLVRLFLAWAFADVGLAVFDERDYDLLASNLVEHGEFSYVPGTPLSLRPPLYPALVAGVYKLFGLHNFTAVRLLQGAIALATTGLVFALGKSLYGVRAGLIAAALHCFYPSLLGAGNLVLSETLFTFLTCLFLLLTAWHLETGSWRLAAAAGAVLGLAALTRSVLWLFPPFVVLPILAGARDRAWTSRLAAAGALVLAFVAVVAPWSVRNSRLQRTFVAIDVMGGRNFMMGNYEYTPEYRPWAAIGLQGERSWDNVLAKKVGGLKGLTQGQVDKAAQRYAIEYMLANPRQTAERTFAKLFHFWQLERELIAGARQGYWGPVSPRVVQGLASLILGPYVLVMGLGLFGACVVPPGSRPKHWLCLLLIGYVTALHALAFGHSRYHLPLMPCLMVYAAAAITRRGELLGQWKSRRFWLAAALFATLAGSWALDVLREAERF